MALATLKTMKDQELLLKTKELVHQERKVLTTILEHLREVDYRKLYCDLGYSSLFDYCVKELGYSEGGAGRRIQAMRLIKELPSVEKKIEEGRLNLSNLSQVQSYFRETKKLHPEKRVTAVEKLELIEKLENKSAREGQSILLSMSPERPMPKERQRPITESVSEVNFLLDKELEAQLTEINGLLGRGTIGMTELIKEMARLSLDQLRAKKFGKKRAKALSLQSGVCDGKAVLGLKIYSEQVSEMERLSTLSVPTKPTLARKREIAPTQELNSAGAARQAPPTPTVVLESSFGASTSISKQAPTSESHRLGIGSLPSDVHTSAAECGARYLPKSVKFKVWVRDKGRCQNCNSRQNLQYDHVQPVALDGESSEENLRLLCFQCNQRAAMRVFGVEKLAQFWE